MILRWIKANSLCAGRMGGNQGGDHESGNTVRQWQMRWAQVRELEALGREQRKALARDIGVPPEMLPALVARGPDAAAELPRLMQALSLDADEIRKIHAALMRDMSLTCSGCTAAVRCRDKIDT